MTPWSPSPRPGVKAGLPPEAWLDEDAIVEHFQAQIFAKLAPGWEVFEKSFLEGSEEMCGASQQSKSDFKDEAANILEIVLLGYSGKSLLA